MFSKVVSSSQCWMYLRYEKAFERIVSSCPAEDCEDGMEYNEEWEDDELNCEDLLVLRNL